MAETTNPAPGRWPFGLSDEEEARAERLHRESVIVDMMHQHPGGANIFRHYDSKLLEEAFRDLKPGLAGVGQAMMLPYRLALNGSSTLIHDWWEQAGVTVGVFGVLMGPPHYVAALGDWEKRLAEITSLPWLRKVTTVPEIRETKAEGSHALYGYCQPVGGLSNNLDDVNRAYDQGLRTLMLTYNRMDYVGAGCTERVDAGLSMYGEQVVARCNELGIVVDTSHCGRQTTLDAVALSQTPVLANHTCAQGVYPHARGKSDEELEAIADSGGVIGVITVPFFLSSEPDASIDVMLDHIDYIAAKVGWEHVGIGTDWPMQGPEHVMEATLGVIVDEIGFRPQDNISTTHTLEGFSDYRDMPNITRGLVKRGYPDEQIQGILGENFLRVFGAVCG